MSQSQADSHIFVTTALHSWNQWLGRADKAFSSISDEQMLAEIAPGKNRIAYIFGHLIAVNDAILPQLGLGVSSFPHLRKIFIEQPDRAAELPSITELREAWRSINQALARHFAELTPEQWLEPHTTVSAEDFAKEPHRNRLGILLGRT
ncbi:MAG TPA: DinB family protein, partial [Acidobacteriaceae bacterium]